MKYATKASVLHENKLKKGKKHPKKHTHSVGEKSTRKNAEKKMENERELG